MHYIHIKQHTVIDSEETVQVRKRIRNICSYGNMLTNEKDYHSEKSLQGDSERFSF